MACAHRFDEVAYVSGFNSDVAQFLHIPQTMPLNCTAEEEVELFYATQQEYKNSLL